MVNVDIFVNGTYAQNIFYGTIYYGVQMETTALLKLNMGDNVSLRITNNSNGYSIQNCVFSGYKVY